MGFSLLPEPGTKYGPCIAYCGHARCEKTRADAEYVCRICDKPIGYRTAYIRDTFPPNSQGWAHAVCLIKEINERK